MSGTAIEQHVRQLIRDESRTAFSELLTPVVTEAAKVAASETCHRIMERERQAAEQLYSPITSADAARRTIDNLTRTSGKRREQFVFYCQDVRRQALEMAMQQAGASASADELIARASKLEQFILWGAAA